MKKLFQNESIITEGKKWTFGVYSTYVYPCVTLLSYWFILRWGGLVSNKSNEIRVRIAFDIITIHIWLNSYSNKTSTFASGCSFQSLVLTRKMPFWSRLRLPFLIFSTILMFISMSESVDLGVDQVSSPNNANPLNGKTLMIIPVSNSATTIVSRLLLCDILFRFVSIFCNYSLLSTDVSFGSIPFQRFPTERVHATDGPNANRHHRLACDSLQLQVN